ncbi:tail protein X [Bosea sp. (in: a-proteobacteria)]|uniref:tail protein X n=1 Tax=Bosea sp. (in: a-proteobacteria) TaxID=1871050 RepID=UPI001AD2A51E|nr:tail protein X [Bosea sp. (in: a-proteobacteria)]MBN9444393.1 tail protein X [Bosea sp. (in: a-proteobacteria)]
MTTIYETYTVESEGLTVSLLVWRRFRQPMFGMVERILEINYGLAEKGIFLPVGTQVMIPVDPPTERAVNALPAIQLWD